MSSNDGRGRHRAQTSPGLSRTAAGLAVTGPLLLPGLVPGTADAATPTDSAVELPTVRITGLLDAIAACESSGRVDASGPVTAAGGHFGLFQFDTATWRSVGGTGNPRSASRAEQYARAAVLLARRGTQPWLASQACWSRKGVSSVAAGSARAQLVVATAPKPVEVRRSSEPVRAVATKPARRSVTTGAGTPVPDGYVIRRGDTLSRIAARFHVPGGYRAIARANGIADPDRIFAGRTLR